MPSLRKGLLLCLMMCGIACAKMVEVDEIVAQAQAEHEVPAVAVGLVVDGELFAKGYGEGIDEKTRFAIGSCTKAFTALVLAQLVEEGRLEWDDPVVEYLPAVELPHPEVSVRDLVAHRSGLGRAGEMWHGQQLSREAFLAALAEMEPDGPRETFRYSNLNYALAGMVIEAVTGQSWEEAVEARLFLPLGMSNSSCRIPESANTATPYALVDGQLTPVAPHRFTQVAPAGGIYSSAADMTKWIELHLSDSPFVRQLQAPQVGISDTEAYGLGWFLRTHQGHPLVEHFGTIDGYAARISLIPHLSRGFVILTNSTGDDCALITTLGDTLLDEMLSHSPSDG